jgi:hypothetical protein
MPFYFLMLNADTGYPRFSDEYLELVDSVSPLFLDMTEIAVSLIWRIRGLRLYPDRAELAPVMLWRTVGKNSESGETYQSLLSSSLPWCEKYCEWSGENEYGHSPLDPLSLRREIETTAAKIVDGPFMDPDKLYDAVLFYAQAHLPDSREKRAEFLCRLYAIGALAAIELMINSAGRHKNLDARLLHLVHVLNAASLEYAGDSNEISARLLAPKSARTLEARRAAVARHGKRNAPAKTSAREHFRDHRAKFASDDKWIQRFRGDFPDIDIAHKTLLNWCTEFRNKRDSGEGA